ncbi:MAG: cation diffusion facilitator family transporter [Dehalococcoidia bacterium]
MAGEAQSKAAVLAAMAANAGIAVAKGIAGLLSGSASMLAEAGHSVADTVNQVFLLIGINLSDTKADEAHPHGYGKEGFFWSFLAAIFIFVAGATFSFYEGGRTLIESHEHDRSEFEVILSFAVLGSAFLFEAFSFSIAIRAIGKGARAKNWGFGRYLRESNDTTTKTVFFEDSAALTGLALAASGLGLSELTGNEAWDGIASLAIGVVLALVALMLGVQSRRLLLGASAHEDTVAAIKATVGSFPEVENIVRILTMQIGQHSILVTGELQVQAGLTLDQAESLLQRIDSRLNEEVPEVANTFWELRREPDRDKVLGPEPTTDDAAG